MYLLVGVGAHPRATPRPGTRGGTVTIVPRDTTCQLVRPVSCELELRYALKFELKTKIFYRYYTASCERVNVIRRCTATRPREPGCGGVFVYTVMRLMRSRACVSTRRTRAGARAGRAAAPRPSGGKNGKIAKGKRICGRGSRANNNSGVHRSLGHSDTVYTFASFLALGGVERNARRS